MNNRRNRLDLLFEKKKTNILSVYFTAGFPRIDSTVPISLSLEAPGVDLIEIGIPFSDPVADGPVIQSSNQAALQNGMNLSLLLEQVAQLRKQCSIPVILMGYCNPVLRYGFQRFCIDSAGAGVDGLILPDLPSNEYNSSYRSFVEAHDLRNIFLVAPTTSEERIRQLDAMSRPFLYAVSASRTTGAMDSFSDAQLQYFSRLKSMKLKNPLLIGFGIANKSTFNKACEFGAGAVVGSAFISGLQQAEDPTAISAFVQGMKGL